MKYVDNFNYVPSLIENVAPLDNKLAHLDSITNFCGYLINYGTVGKVTK